jgi:hypothetical protein
MATPTKTAASKTTAGNSKNSTPAKTAAEPVKVNPEISFRKYTCDWLGNIAGLIDELRAVKLTNMPSGNVNTASELLEDYEATELVEMFIEKNNVWKNILACEGKKADAKEWDFLINDIPKLFSKVPFDPKVLVEPIIGYRKLLKDGFKGSHDENTFPIKENDMVQQIKYFNVLIKLACRYHQAHPNKKYDLSFYIQKYNM